MISPGTNPWVLDDDHKRCPTCKGDGFDCDECGGDGLVRNSIL